MVPKRVTSCMFVVKPAELWLRQCWKIEMSIFLSLIYEEMVSDILHALEE